jgi:DGQHR domain-containing protein
MLNTTQLTVRIPAIQGAYGHRLATYSTQISPRALEAFLGHDPRSRYWKKLDPELEAIYSQLQRNTTADRLRAIQAYIRKRFTQRAVVVGAFPAVSIAVKRHLLFEPFEAAGRDMAGAGTLHLEMSKANGRIVLDGLARVSGTIELVELANDDRLTEEERASLNELLDQFTLPLVIFAPREEGKPLDMRELRQLFADFNFKQTSISPSMAIAMDSSDLYIEATNRLGGSDFFKAMGGIERGRASLGSKSTALVVQQNLLRFVRGAAEGDRFTEAKTNVDKDDSTRRMNEENLEVFVQSVERFLSGMAQVMGEDRFRDSKNGIHLSGPGWGALGSVFYDLDSTLQVQDLDGMGRRVGEIDWQRSAPFWEDIMREKIVRGTPTITFIGGGYESRQALRRKVHEHLGTWNALQQTLSAEAEVTDPDSGSQPNASVVPTEEPAQAAA